MLRFNTKVGVVMMFGILGTISQAMKQLKIPRIYNALITTDEMLLPSQAYPAITPVIHGVHYNVNGYIPVSPYYAIPNVPVIQDYGLSGHHESSAEGNPFRGSNVIDPSRQYLTPNSPEVRKTYSKTYSSQNQNFKYSSVETEENQLPVSNSQNVARKSEPELNNPVPISNLDVVKNNRPTNPDIVDVPPPPLPISRQSTEQTKPSEQKKPSEYPPPPIGFL